MIWPWATSLSSIFFIILFSLLILRFFRKTSALHILQQWWFSFENRLHLYQSFKIPLYNHHFQENQLYRKILTYLDSLPSVQDSDFTNLFSGPNPSDIFLHLDANHTVHDTFLGANLSWTNHTAAGDSNSALVLRIKKKDKRRVFRQYFQHILSVAEEIEQRRKKDVKLYLNSGAGEISPWRSVPFTHPASFETVAMDAELKNKVKSDLDQFLKSKQYYHRLGRVWKRSYLLYGASGTGKSSFVAAMAKFLCYDVYDIDVSKVTDGSDWKMLLMQTTPKSMIVIEDLDRLIKGKSTGVSLSSVLNFMDGIVSCCGEERVMVFTMNGTKDEVDQTVLRPDEINDTNAVICRESVHTVREFRKLYGLLRLGSRRKEEPIDSSGPLERETARIEGRVG
ncbi:P-loop containing nucleoside triphosphate hydrolase [Sesbania bispinosa]|nr:P-loop containing nucleoside triphosphate hydrolase [Sesbania bispinosa]